MANAIHLICRRDDSGRLTGLALYERPDVYRSIAWEISPEDAAALVGGWVYFHPKKAQVSEFGGRVLKVEEAGSATAYGRPEIALIVRSLVAGKGQKWRGTAHGMAWTGGLVETTLPHEQGAA
ncbi:MAG TPA: hypothetical protein VLI93_01515 [Acetobacteraceae bacterium]|nr:hypothetical protein [Acetobacteraceae bacterium]